MIKQVKENVYCITGPINVGLIQTDRGFVVIDTGLDESYGRKIIKAVEELDGNIIGIINTHSHADHFGGNNYIRKRINIWTIASKMEKALIENPVFEPIYLFGGAPFSDMRTKFTEGKPSYIDMIVEEEKTVKFLGDLGISIFPLYGHSPAQIGISYNDILFIGDVVMPENVMNKYKLGYLYDVSQEKQALEKLKDIDKEFFVPGHGELMDFHKLKRLIELNLENISMIEGLILKILKDEPLSSEALFSHLIEVLNIEPDLIQVLLLFSTVKGFLSGLKKEGVLEFFIEEGKIMWKKRA